MFLHQVWRCVLVRSECVSVMCECLTQVSSFLGSGRWFGHSWSLLWSAHSVSSAGNFVSFTWRSAFVLRHFNSFSDLLSALHHHLMLLLLPLSAGRLQSQESQLQLWQIILILLHLIQLQYNKWYNCAFMEKSTHVHFAESFSQQQVYLPRNKTWLSESVFVLLLVFIYCTFVSKPC